MTCRNNSKLLPDSFPGVYQLDCTCNALYIGDTKNKVITKTIEHQQDSFNGKWESSGATGHCLECHRQFNWIKPKTLSSEKQYHRRKIRESLEIEMRQKWTKEEKFWMAIKEISWRQTHGLHSLLNYLKRKPTQRLDVKFRNGFQ